MSSPSGPVPRPCRSAEHGFALVEVLVSAVLLLIMSAALFATLDVSGATAGQDRAKTQATSLARSAQQALRTKDLFSNATSTGAPPTVPVTTTKVGGTTFTVTTTTAWASDDVSVANGDCTSSGGTAGTIDYLRIRTVVSWAGMRKAAQADSLIAPPVALNTTAGTVAVKLQRTGGTPVPNTYVRVDSRQTLTNAYGCAFFPAVLAGLAHEAGVNTTGWVDNAGEQDHEEAVEVTARQTTLVQIDYDPAANWTVNFDSRNPADGQTSANTVVGGVGFPVATVNGVSLVAPLTFGSAAGSAQTSFAVGPVAQTASGYAAYAGQCPGNDPSSYTAYGASAQNWTIATNPATMTLRVPTVSVRAQRVSSGFLGGTEYSPATGMKVVFTPDTTSSGTQMTTDCATYTSTVPSPNTDANPDNGSEAGTYTQRRIRLPFGRYKMCVSAGGYKVSGILVDNRGPNGQLLAKVPIQGGGGIFGGLGTLLGGLFGGSASSASGSC